MSFLYYHCIWVPVLAQLQPELYPSTVSEASCEACLNQFRLITEYTL